jgi:HAL2 family 3'(2'),5'-bisphosphate nucleotidase
VYLRRTSPKTPAEKGLSYQREFETAVEAVREAARLCRSVQARLAGGVMDKQDRSPVTVADFGSQALICRVLREAFPGDPVVAEEDAAELRQPERAALREQVVAEVRALQPGADAEAIYEWIDHGRSDRYHDRFWTLDPIDGTKGFLRGEQFAVALALIVDGEVQVAALACPSLGEDPLTPDPEGTLYAAIRGQGAQQLPLFGSGAARPVRVSARRDPATVQYCESVESAHSAQGEAATVASVLGLTAPPVRVDSQAKYALVARGTADLYLRLPTRPGYVERIWDHAAGALVIEEAGGTVTDMYGQPLDFRHGRGLARNKGIVATNGPLHDPVLGALRETGIAPPA